MKKYSMGFIFNKDLTQVLLIHKLRPEWQAGKVNGIGGKIEDGETAVDCIVREVTEETGLISDKKNWIWFGQITNHDGATSELFYFVYQGSEDDAKTMEEEKIEWFGVNAFPTNVMTNLHWLIPLAFDTCKNKKIQKVFVEY